MSLAIALNHFVLEHTFNKIVLKTGEVVWWRDCILQPGMKHGEQGYMIVWEDGKAPATHHHTYHYPPNLFEGEV